MIIIHYIYFLLLLLYYLFFDISVDQRKLKLLEPYYCVDHGRPWPEENQMVLLLIFELKIGLINNNMMVNYFISFFINAHSLKISYHCLYHLIQEEE